MGSSGTGPAAAPVRVVDGTSMSVPGIAWVMGRTPLHRMQRTAAPGGGWTFGFPHDGQDSFGCFGAFVRFRSPIGPIASIRRLAPRHELVAVTSARGARNPSAIGRTTYPEAISGRTGRPEGADYHVRFTPVRDPSTRGTTAACRSTTSRPRTTSS